MSSVSAFGTSLKTSSCSCLGIMECNAKIRSLVIGSTSKSSPQMCSQKSWYRNKHFNNRCHDRLPWAICPLRDARTRDVACVVQRRQWLTRCHTRFCCDICRHAKHSMLTFVLHASLHKICSHFLVGSVKNLGPTSRPPVFKGLRIQPRTLS